jgi:hypothetical protein
MKPSAFRSWLTSAAIALAMTSQSSVKADAGLPTESTAFEFAPVGAVVAKQSTAEEGDPPQIRAGAAPGGYRGSAFREPWS